MSLQVFLIRLRAGGEKLQKLEGSASGIQINEKESILYMCHYIIHIHLHLYIYMYFFLFGYMLLQKGASQAYAAAWVGRERSRS